MIRRLVAVALCAVLAACATAPEEKPEPEAEAEAGDKEQEKPAVSEQTRSQFAEAVAALEADDAERAAALLEPMADNKPVLPGALANLGIAYHRLERPQEARAVLERAVAADPELAVAHNELGILHREQGRFDAARAAYERALAIDADYANAHLNLGVLCDLYLQQLDCALEHYKAYQEITPEKDEKVAIWIADISRRQESGQ